MRASTWTAAVSCAVLLSAAALLCGCARAPRSREPFSTGSDLDVKMKITMCSVYRGIAESMIGFFFAFSNALLLEHLQDPTNREAASELIDTINGEDSLEAKIHLMTTYLVANSSNPRAAQALASVQVLENATAAGAEGGCIQ